VADLSSSLDSLRDRVDALQSASPAKPPTLGEGSVFIKSPGSAHLDPSCSQAAQGLFGHGVHHSHRGVGLGTEIVLEPPPVKGEPTSSPTSHHEFPHCHTNCCQGHHSFHNAMPSQDFPKFDGTNPKLWLKKCESQF
jgi:hypothetical protein